MKRIALALLVLCCAASAYADTKMVYIRMPGCQWCDRMEPYVEAMEKAGYNIERVVMQDREAPEFTKWNTVDMPTFVFLKDGKETERIPGACAMDRLIKAYNDATDLTVNRKVVVRKSRPPTTPAAVAAQAKRVPDATFVEAGPQLWKLLSDLQKQVASALDKPLACPIPPTPQVEQKPLDLSPVVNALTAARLATVEAIKANKTLDVAAPIGAAVDRLTEANKDAFERLATIQRETSTQLVSTANKFAARPTPQTITVELGPNTRKWLAEELAKHDRPEPEPMPTPPTPSYLPLELTEYVTVENCLFAAVALLFAGAFLIVVAWRKKLPHVAIAAAIVLVLCAGSVGLAVELHQRTAVKVDSATVAVIVEETANRTQAQAKIINDKSLDPYKSTGQLRVADKDVHGPSLDKVQWAIKAAAKSKLPVIVYGSKSKPTVKALPSAKAIVGLLGKPSKKGN